MKTSILATCSILLLLSKLNAQSDIKFESLKLNSSAAYVVLGVEPDNIQRPSSPTQFISGIQNSIVNGKLKPNVAVEFTPYYWAKPNTTDSTKFRPSEYLLAPSNLIQHIVKTTSFSFVTSESDTVTFGKLKPGTALGIGLKFILAEGKPKNGAIVLLREWNEAIVKEQFYGDLIKKLRTLNADNENTKGYTSAILDLVSEYENISLLNPDFNSLSYSYSKKIIKEVSTELIKALQEKNFAQQSDFINYLTKPRDVNLAIAEKKLADINAKGKIPFAKQGFMLEFAAGEALVFQENKFSNATHAKTSFWLTPTYRWQMESSKNEINLFDLMGVLRYTINNSKEGVDVSNYFDAGSKIQYTTNKSSFSFEGVYRYASKLPMGFSKKSTWRWVSSFDYKISDIVTFKFTFGTSFNGNTTTYTKSKDIFALGGLNLGLFNPKN